jgi:PAS domain S-box-containing protein
VTPAAATTPLGGTLFASFLEAIADAIVGVIEDGCILMVNAQAEALFGDRRDDLIGRQLEMLVPASAVDHSQLRARYFQDPVPRPMGVGMELAARRHDGSEFPAEISLAWIEIDAQLLVIAAVRDITERKRAEAKFRSLLEAARDAIVGVNPDGLNALVNSQAEALFGYRRNQLIGRPVELLVPGAADNIHSPSHSGGWHGRSRVPSRHRDHRHDPPAKRRISRRAPRCAAIDNGPESGRRDDPRRRG